MGHAESASSLSTKVSNAAQLGTHLLLRVV